ncbi:pectin lyase fold/virulence factor [Jimgerdemannia flammicorona]|nr:pectin lyase fold/virulence factor [Jimgerdemannia flammicorona]
MTVLGNNTQVYNIRIHGEDHGATDGIDIGGWHNHVHHVHVTNRDECVTVASPSSNILIENVFCDNAGATNIGSLGKGGGTAFIQNIVMRNNVYYQTEWAVGIKAYPCANGIVRNITWENLIMDQVVYPV